MPTTTRHWISAALIALCLLWTMAELGRPAYKIGDRVQIALPLIGAICAFDRREIGEYAGRFVGAMAVVHGLKGGLGGRAFNSRPDGRPGGFPSGHSASAAFGASYLARSCATRLPWVGPASILAAGFVGGSRIEGGKHDLWQVIAGATIGVLFDLMFRGPRSRRWIVGRWVSFNARTRRLASKVTRCLRGPPI